MQRYFCEDKNGEIFNLSGNDMHHIKNVMRMKTNDKIEVVYDKKLYLCEIKGDEILLIKECENAKDETEIILLMPVLKERKIDYILQKSTELGVSKIIPIQMERCNINYGQKKENKVLRWNKICKEASEQSKRLTVPIVENITDFKHLKIGEGFKILCSTNEKEKSIKNVLKSTKIYDKLYIVAGPEGGLTLLEEENLKQQGFVPVTLGNRILRTETVPLFVLSAINYEMLE